jgi:hypothetical protein
MNQLTIELLTKERVTELWPVLEPLLESACEGNAIAKGEMDAGHILMAVQLDKAVVFAGSFDDQITCVLALQFFEVNKHKGADVMALAGRHLLKFKAAFWEPILTWLRANDVEFLDAYTPTNRAEIYLKKFGFDESCAYVRMNLGVNHE